MNFYDLLGVAPGASTQEVRRAFRERARRYHPDVNDHPRAAEQFKVLTTARDVLVDDEERAAYDRLGHADYVDRRLGKPLPDVEMSADPGEERAEGFDDGGDEGPGGLAAAAAGADDASGDDGRSDDSREADDRSDRRSKYGADVGFGSSDDGGSGTTDDAGGTASAGDSPGAADQGDPTADASTGNDPTAGTSSKDDPTAGASTEGDAATWGSTEDGAAAGQTDAGRGPDPSEAGTGAETTEQAGAARAAGEPASGPTGGAEADGPSPEGVAGAGAGAGAAGGAGDGEPAGDGGTVAGGAAAGQRRQVREGAAGHLSASRRWLAVALVAGAYGAGVVAYLRALLPLLWDLVVAARSLRPGAVVAALRASRTDATLVSFVRAGPWLAGSAPSDGALLAAGAALLPLVVGGAVAGLRRGTNWQPTWLYLPPALAPAAAFGAHYAVLRGASPFGPVPLWADLALLVALPGAGLAAFLLNRLVLVRPLRRREDLVDPSPGP